MTSWLTLFAAPSGPGHKQSANTNKTEGGWFRRALSRRLIYGIRYVVNIDAVAEERTGKSTLPEVIDLPAADDEVHVLLDRHRLAKPKGHLDQAIRAHSEGNWAAANGQFRTFLESLFDEIALHIDSANAHGTRTGETRRQLRVANAIRLAGDGPRPRSEPRVSGFSMRT